MSELKVAYACDNGYIEQTGISIISLLENNKKFDAITVYLISKGIKDDNIAIIHDICNKYGRTLKVIGFDEIAYDLNISQIGRHIETIYAKIFFSRIEGLQKILYIDSDTIIDGSLADLWKLDITDYYMGMVQTYTGIDAKMQLSMPNDSLFFNDGVALVNVNYCRRHDLIRQCLDTISFYGGNPPVLSEGLLNKVCEGKILALSPKYNMMSGLYQRIGLSPNYVSQQLAYPLDDLIDSYNNPIIIHYLSGFYNRPWNIECSHPLKTKYFLYKQDSYWKNSKLKSGTLLPRIKLLGVLLNVLGPRKFDILQNFIKNLIK